MITFTSEFECGNGRNFRSIGTRRYRLEVVGDKPVYCYYFCFDVRNAGGAEAIAIEVWHDPVIDDIPGFISHFPCTIWMSRGATWDFTALDPRQCEVHDDHIVIHLAPAAGETVRLSNLYPVPYSTTRAFLERLGAERPDRCELFSIGQSVQGREILGLRAGAAGGPRVLCIAGQHPIEFSGAWAMRAIADFISSRIPAAAALRERWQVEVIPLVNPDGTGMGRNGFTAEGLDMYVGFGQEPDAPEPQGRESRLLWRWATARPLALWYNVHNYLGWRAFREPPYDGWYAVPYTLFKDSRQALLFEALCDTVRLETAATSGHDAPNAHGANTLCYQLAARYGIPHVFYEINGSTGGAFQAGERGLKIFRQAMGTLLSMGMPV